MVSSSPCSVSQLSSWAISSVCETVIRSAKRGRSERAARSATSAASSRPCWWWAIMPWAKATSSAVAAGRVAGAATSGRTRLDSPGAPSWTTGAVPAASGAGSSPEQSRDEQQEERGGARDGGVHRVVAGGLRCRDRTGRSAAPSGSVWVARGEVVVEASVLRRRGTRRRRMTAALGAVVLLGLAVPLAGEAQTDPRVGLAPGYFPWSEASSNMELVDNDPRVGAVRRRARQLRFRQLRPRLHRQQRHRRQLQRLPGLRHLRQRRAGAAELVRVPRRAG